MINETENIYDRDYSSGEILSPKKSIIEHCRNCRGNNNPITCDYDSCALHRFRSSGIPWTKGQSRNAAIRSECLSCCNGDTVAVRECHITDCALWPYKSGRRAQ